MKWRDIVDDLVTSCRSDSEDMVVMAYHEATIDFAFSSTKNLHLQHTNAKFRVDANCAWTAEESIKKSTELKALGVEFIEQPMPADNWDDMKDVFVNCALPLIADESCKDELDIEKYIGTFHGINIKVMQCGGLTPALRMIKKRKA